MKRTGGEKTDELLGSKTGPEGLPDSIIVTADGIEGDAPLLPRDERAVAAPEEPQREEDEPVLPTLAPDNADAAIKGKKVKVQQARPKGRGQQQAILPFIEKTRPAGNKKMGKKHGTKKTKK